MRGINLQAVNEIQEILEGIFPQFLADLGIDWINWITFTLILEALLLLFVILVIRLISKRRAITIKLSTPKLPETAEKISGETLAGLKALFISTQGALKILNTLQDKKEIDSHTFKQLSLRYKEQLAKIQDKLTEELDSVERERLRQLYEGAISPPGSAPDTTPTSSTPPSPPSSDTSSAPPMPPSAPPSAPPMPPSAPPSAPPMPPGAPPSAPPVSPFVDETKQKKPKKE